jgi:hypothetical protein
MIKEGSFVKIIKKRNYDFIDHIYLQVLKVYDITINSKGEQCLELMADDYLINKDSYLEYKGVIGFTPNEVQEVTEDDIEQGRIDNINYKQELINKQIEYLKLDYQELQNEKIKDCDNQFIRTVEHLSFSDSISKLMKQNSI